MVYFVVIYFSLLLFYSISYKRWRAGSYLIGVYFISAIFSLIIFNGSGGFLYKDISFSPTLLYCICLLFFFIPFIRKDLPIKPTISPKSLKNVGLIGNTLGIALMGASVAILPLIIIVFAFGAGEAREFAVQGESILMGITNTWQGYAIAFLRWFSPLSYMLLTLFFYIFTFVEGKKVLKIVLFISSLSATFFGFLSAGRTNLIYWVLFAGFLYVIFRPYMTKEKLRVFKLASIPLLIAILGYIAMVTVSRFGEGGTGAQNGIVEYAGTPYLNFCLYFDQFHTNNFTLRRIFPFITSLFNGEFVLLDYKQDLYMETGMSIGVFYTLLGDFYVDTGIIGVIIYPIVFMLISNAWLNKKKCLDLSSLLVLGIVYQIPLHGLFYYSLWKIDATIGCFVVYIISRILKK